MIEIELMDAADELYLVKLLKKVLLANKDMEQTFLCRLIKQQLKCLLPNENGEMASGK